MVSLHTCTFKKITGTKIDLRAETREKPIKTEMGEQMAKDLKAVKYLECSAKTREGLKDVFDEALMTALQPKTKPKPCTLLQNDIGF